MVGPVPWRLWAHADAYADSAPLFVVQRCVGAAWYNVHVLLVKRTRNPRAAALGHCLGVRPAPPCLPYH